jgi:O-antigen/teichoic acid export membrane protein
MVWGVGFMVIRDLLQFAGTVILARLLTPSDYGVAALSLMVLSLVSIASFKSIILHALQTRDPAQIDWQSHFSGGLAINLAAGLMMLVVGSCLAFIPVYASASLLVCTLSVAMFTDLLGGLRFAMLQCRHEWARYRTLLFIGAVVAMAVSIGAAFLGAGPWALLAGTVLLNVPAALDLVFVARWRPNLKWPRSDYNQSLKFGLNRAASSLMTAGRQIVEHSAIVALNSFSALGIFTRSFGLSTMLSGRFGLIVVQTLYPVLTRAEARTQQFQHAAGLLLAGTAWVTIPAAAFLACTASETVGVLYGSQWSGVTQLLPIVSVLVAITGLTQCASQLLLANERPGLCLKLDGAGGVASLVLLVVALPQGLETYLAASSFLAIALLAATLANLRRALGIAAGAVRFAFVPPVVATACAVGAVILAQQLGLGGAGAPFGTVVLIWVGKGVLFAAVFFMILTWAFPGAFRELLFAVPGGQKVAKLLRLRRGELAV